MAKTQKKREDTVPTREYLEETQKSQLDQAIKINEEIENFDLKDLVTHLKNNLNSNGQEFSDILNKSLSENIKLILPKKKRNLNDSVDDLEIKNFLSNSKNLREVIKTENLQKIEKGDYLVFNEQTKNAFGRLLFVTYAQNVVVPSLSLTESKNEDLSRQMLALTVKIASTANSTEINSEKSSEQQVKQNAVNFVDFVEKMALLPAFGEKLSEQNEEIAKKFKDLETKKAELKDGEADVTQKFEDLKQTAQDLKKEEKQIEIFKAALEEKQLELSKLAKSLTAKMFIKERYTGAVALKQKMQTDEAYKQAVKIITAIDELQDWCDLTPKPAICYVKDTGRKKHGREIPEYEHKYEFISFERLRLPSGWEKNRENTNFDQRIEAIASHLKSSYGEDSSDYNKIIPKKIDDWIKLGSNSYGDEYNSGFIKESMNEKSIFFYSKDKSSYEFVKEKFQIIIKARDTYMSEAKKIKNDLNIGKDGGTGR